MSAQFVLRLGDFQVRLVPYSHHAQIPVNRFANVFHPFLVQAPSSECLHNLIIATAPVDAGADIPACLSDANDLDWQAFCQGLGIAYRRFCQARFFRKVTGDDLDTFVFAWTQETRSSGGESARFTGLVLEESDDAHLHIFGYLLQQAAHWHLQRGGLFIHSAAVAFGINGFLFLGESGAGKTTISVLSNQVGREVLGDDLNFIIKETQGTYHLAASPSPITSPIAYSMARPILRGIFALVKDGRDYLVPLSPKQMACAMFDGFVNQTPYVSRLPSEAMQLAFCACCNIARTVPGYELHFRKSPEFWKLIDEQFPD